MEKIKISGLQKSYTNRKKKTTVALYKCDLEVHSGEFLVLLGESGCGKTSLLKVLAGIESYDYGDVFIDGISADKLTQAEKNMSYVSQNYSLFPHQTVFENIMQPLEINKTPKADRIKRVEELASLFGIEILLTRRPRELSGGQQQKVAIARALAKEPAICLFDEPLSALDEAYHDEIIELLIDIHNKTNSTYIYSTHNQKEAFRLGDRIAIMNNRKFEQVGTQRELVDHPKTLFVASFLKDIFALIIPFDYDAGYINNSTLRIHKEMQFEPSFARKINSKQIEIAIKSSNIHLNEDGKVYFKIINQSANTITVEYGEQEFILANPEMKDFFGYARVDIDFEGCPIFFEGKNIEYEDI
ncbi:MAG: ABC transporter ATP-binding protein [Bacilli bacterium]|nr:ABC transporter ATP-binding protein [Bacilli bacterium]